MKQMRLLCLTKRQILGNLVAMFKPEKFKPHSSNPLRVSNLVLETSIIGSVISVKEICNKLRMEYVEMLYQPALIDFFLGVS